MFSYFKVQLFVILKKQTPQFPLILLQSRWAIVGTYTYFVYYCCTMMFGIIIEWFVGCAFEYDYLQ